MKTPHFIGIGAQRGATTWLFECLQQHPDVFVPSKKEIHYFDENYEKGWDWYLAHFAPADDGQCWGEITPNYLDAEVAAERIAKDCPSAKLFAVLREPVSRAISSYQLLGHRFTEGSFEEACQPGKYLVELGLYAKHLKRFFQHFPKEQLKVLLFDDVKSRPDDVLRELCEHLEVACITAPSSEPRHGGHVNTTVFPGLQNKLDSMGLGGLSGLVKASPFARVLRRLADRSKKKKTQNIDRQRFREFFRDDVLELQTLIDRDLSAWLT